MAKEEIEDYIISHLNYDSEEDFDEDVFDQIIKNNLEE